MTLLRKFENVCNYVYFSLETLSQVSPFILAGLIIPVAGLVCTFISQTPSVELTLVRFSPWLGYDSVTYSYFGFYCYSALRHRLKIAFVFYGSSKTKKN
jgi:hypothetical protein